MAIGPILSGRVPNSLSQSRALSNIQTHSLNLQRLQDQLSTGERYQLPSEDPASAIRALVLQNTIERNSQVEKNIQQNQSFLAATDSALGSFSNIFDQAKGLVLSGVGKSVTGPEKEQLAAEVRTLIDQALNAVNSQHGGRYLFAGTNSETIPFESLASGVRYNGDDIETHSYISLRSTAANSLNPNDAFRPFSSVVGTDINPTLATSASLSSLRGGDGVGDLGVIEVTIDIGAGDVTEQIDLSGADSVQDIITRLEAPFGGDLTVQIDPASNFGLHLEPSAGTVKVTDLEGSNIARQLGIESAAVTEINGDNLDPQISLQTTLASLNNGTGIGATAGNGLQIQLGSETKVIDLDGLTTVEDLFNELRTSGFDLKFGINKAGNGLEISSRVSGADFSIGENGGSNADSLGIRTFNGSTKLSDLNDGAGVETTGDPFLKITRRDGTTESEVDLSNAKTIQDVITAINAVDAGVLVATLNATGNGISITDSSGTDPLVILDNQAARQLGIDGTESGTDNTVAIVGRDVNPQRSEGLFDILKNLEQALLAGDDTALQNLDKKLQVEFERFTVIRGHVGSRLQLLDRVQNQLLDQNVELREALSVERDADLTETISSLTNAQVVLEATLRVTSQSFNLNLFSFL